MQSRAGERGATLLDVVVGSALMTMVFVGIVGAFQLSVDAVSNNKARAGAIALTNERLEYIRSLAYDSVGTVGGIPSGALEQVATTSLNNVLYTRRTFISYEDDPQDGSGGADSNGVTADYRAVKVSVSWDSRQGTRTVTMATRLSPPSGVESAIPGGTIAVDVVDALAVPITNASVRIYNPTLVPVVDLTTYTDSAGLASVIGAPAGAGYQLVVTKPGYSLSQTYSADATTTNPIPAHLGVALNQTTAASFAIDVLSSMRVETYKKIEEETWVDPFSDGENVASSTAIEVSGGAARLIDSGGYPESGALIAEAISIPLLSQWKELSWNDGTPAGTGITYHVYDSSYELIPDAVLPGNSAGFTSSPVSLTGISTSTYALIRPGAILTTTDASTTPSVNSWTLTYDVGPTPLPSIPLTLQGAKTIGSGPAGPTYKYSVVHTTGSDASKLISNLEYDSYTLSVAAATEYDVSSSCSVQPVTLAPATSMTTRLYLAPHTTNSLLIDVKSAAGVLIPNATVRLYRAPYDTTEGSDACGQAFFSSLSTGSVGSGNPYSIEVSAPGYTTFSSSEVGVSGNGRLSVVLN